MNRLHIHQKILRDKLPYSKHKFATICATTINNWYETFNSFAAVWSERRTKCNKSDAEINWLHYTCPWISLTAPSRSHATVQLCLLSPSCKCASCHLKNSNDSINRYFRFFFSMLKYFVRRFFSLSVCVYIEKFKSHRITCGGWH